MAGSKTIESKLRFFLLFYKFNTVVEKENNKKKKNVTRKNKVRPQPHASGQKWETRANQEVPTPPTPKLLLSFFCCCFVLNRLTQFHFVAD
jgi:hypothetical protein